MPRAPAMAAFMARQACVTFSKGRGGEAATQTKTAAPEGGRFVFDHRVEEIFPFLADLAATYSSKP